ncbi:MAG TPA: MATE family efflux transporter, partial [Firmicutes bacterium]|nr:MATE family efflux transporter [Bacillota bacterium]
TILLLLFGRYLMMVFTSTPDLVDFSVRMLRILAFGYIAVAVTQSLSGVMRGAGDTMTPMWISLITTVGLRVPVAYGLAYLTRSELYPTGRPESVFVSLLISWTLGALITFAFFKRGAWRYKGITRDTEREAV